MKQITAEWLKSAQDDLITIEEIINNERLTYIVAFHAQQAIERSFKAVLEEKEQHITRVHDLFNLYSRVKIEIGLELDKENIRKLNEMYIDSRYPGDMGLLPNGEPSVDEAKAFFQFAQSVYNDIYSKLSGG